MKAKTNAERQRRYMEKLRSRAEVTEEKAREIAQEKIKELAADLAKERAHDQAHEHAHDVAKEASDEAYKEAYDEAYKEACVLTLSPRKRTWFSLCTASGHDTKGSADSRLR